MFVSEWPGKRYAVGPAWERARSAGYPAHARHRAGMRQPGTGSHRLSAMAATDPADEISELSSKLASVAAVLDPDAMKSEVESLREQAADPDL